MRRAAKIDANQAEIAEALIDLGASVQSLASVGRGTPDLLVGFRGMNFLLEVKDGAKPPSKRDLTDDQRRWHDAWKGSVIVVETVADALRALGA